MRNRDEIKADILETTFNIISDIEREDFESLQLDNENLKSLYDEKELLDYLMMKNITEK